NTNVTAHAVSGAAVHAREARVVSSDTAVWSGESALSATRRACRSVTRDTRRRTAPRHSLATGSRLAPHGGDTAVFHGQPLVLSWAEGPPVGGRDETRFENVQPGQHGFELFTGAEIQIPTGGSVVLLDVLGHLVILVLRVERVAEHHEIGRAHV